MGKEDLRSIKTERALDIAMLSLLETRNFRKITVKDLCDKALVSRAAFYAHFTDKYDLLRGWLIYLIPKDMNLSQPYENLEKKVNQFFFRNQAIIKNLIHSADDATLEILFDSILSTLDLPVEKNEKGEMTPRYAALSRFYIGGIFHYLSWQVKNKFPPDVAPMNTYFYEIIEKFRELQFKR